MRLSEAIRFGAMLRPQGFGVLFTIAFSHDESRAIASCALGAGLEAAGLKHVDEFCYHDDEEIELFIAEHFADINRELSLVCPACTVRRYSTLESMIPHLNDAHMWTRERIADYVATIEEQYGMFGVQPVETSEPEIAAVR